MSTIKYMVGTNIVKVPVERESASSIWTVGGRREAKTDVYFDTWAEAHQRMGAEAERLVHHARRQLELANARLGNVKGMKEPAP